MKILGIRNAPSKIRFCILEGDETDFSFVNCDTENKIDLPKSLKTEYEIYAWLMSEYKRIFDKYGPFNHMGLKQNENMPARYSSLKPIMFMDCIATIVAIQNNTSFSAHVYNSLGTKSKEVIGFVETQVVKSAVNWDTQIADAVAVAIKYLKS